MKFSFFFIFLVLLFNFFVSSCNNKKKIREKVPSYDTELLIGPWEDQSEAELHFILFEDGTAQSDNMETLLFQQWFVENDRLYLVAKSIGNAQTFIDTLGYVIQKLNEEELELKRDNHTSKFKKRISEVETLKGHVVWGHEVRTFTPCGSNQTFWVADDSGKLKDAYHEFTLKDKEVYQSIYAELEVEYKEKASEGFPANYDGVYEVLNIKETRAAQDDDCE